MADDFDLTGDSPEQDYSPAPDVDNSPEPSTPEPVEPSVWDGFKSLPDFQGKDDRAIASSLYQAMQREKAATRQLQQYQGVMPIAQEYLANKQEFEKWRSAQSQQVQQAQQLARSQQPQQKESWWNPPKVRDGYKRYLTKDENGREIISPDAPMDARHELLEYTQYQADFAKKFLQNPTEALGPMVQELAAKQAEEIVQKRFERQQEDSFIDNIEKEYSDLLMDENNQVTPTGILIHKYIDEAKSRGINGAEPRWEYALAMTERDRLAQHFDMLQAQSQQQVGNQAQAYTQQAPQQAYQPAPVQQVQEQAAPDLARQNMEWQRREASRNPSRSAGAGQTDPRAPRQKQSFEQMLRANASASGLS